MNETHSIEERVKILEKLLVVEQPFDIPSPDRTPSVLKTDIQIQNIDNRIETLERAVEDLESEHSEIMDKVEELEMVGVSEDEVTDRIKHCLKKFLRNSLGLEVSFDDKR
jgi:hypothetical protein